MEKTGYGFQAGDQGKARFEVCHTLEQVMTVKRGWNVDIFQLTPGKLHYQLCALHLQNMQIFRERSDRSLIKRGESLPDSIVISLLANNEGCGWLLGHPLDTGQALLFHGERLPEVVTPANMDLFYLTVDRAWFLRKAQEQGYGELISLKWQQTSIALTSSDDLRVMLTSILDPTRWPAVECSKAALDTFQERFVHRLFEAIATSTGHDPIIETRQKAVVDGARFIIRNAATDAPRLADVAKTLGVSCRYLQRCFIQSTGATRHRGRARGASLPGAQGTVGGAFVWTADFHRRCGIVLGVLAPQPLCTQLPRAFWRAAFHDGGTITPCKF